MHEIKLSQFKWVVVRLSCHVCSRRGRLRLARLAEAYGAETDLATVLKGVSADCPYRTDKMRNAGGCKAFFPDLERPPDEPPDLPPALMGPQLVWSSEPEPPSRGRDPWLKRQSKT